MSEKLKTPNNMNIDLKLTDMHFSMKLYNICNRLGDINTMRYSDLKKFWERHNNPTDPFHFPQGFGKVAYLELSELMTAESYQQQVQWHLELIEENESYRREKLLQKMDVVKSKIRGLNNLCYEDTMDIEKLIKLVTELNDVVCKK